VKKIAGLQVAAVASVMRNKLRDRPIHMSRVAERHTVRREILFTQARRHEENLKVKQYGAFPAGPDHLKG
jgi:hypothetical protein